MGLESLTVDHVDRAIEQTGDVILQPDVIEKSDVGFRIDIDHDVDIAVGPVLAACHGAEYGCMRDAARAQGAFIVAQSGDGVLGIHSKKIPRPVNSAVQLPKLGPRGGTKQRLPPA